MTPMYELSLIQYCWFISLQPKEIVSGEEDSMTKSEGCEGVRVSNIGVLVEYHIGTLRLIDLQTHT